jgi:glycosyltransferase involved in cell wall biosynthesis
VSGRINVLNVRNVYAYGGSDTALLGWCKAIDRATFDVSVALFDNGDGAEAYALSSARALGLKTFQIPGGRRRRLWASVRTLIGMLREQRIHILHLHDVKSDLLGLVAARIVGVPVVGSAYAWFEDTSFFRARVYEWLDVRLLRRCEFVLAISEKVRQQTIARGIPAARVVTMFSGIDVQAFDVTVDREAARDSLGIAAGDLAIGNIARLFPEKGQEYLIGAMPRVLERVPAARLVMVGEGPLLDQLRAQAARLGLESRVTFVGFRRDLPQVLKALDLQVHSSLKEGLPVAVCSGMAAGLPVISTDIDGVSEVMTAGETGLLVPAADAGALADAMIALLEDPSRMQRLGAAARRTMHQRFRLEHVVRTLEDVYQNVYARHYPREGGA